MNEQPVIPPPPRAGAGCLGVGCLSFVGFFLFIAVAFVAGGFWAINHLRHTYSSTEPLPMPQVETTESESSSSTSTASAPPASTAPLPATSESPAFIPTPTATATVQQSFGGPVQQRWKDFEKAAHHHRPAHIELTANDINTLIADDPKTSGKAFVTIENNVGHVRVSIPLKGFVFMNGRYLNGEATVRASANGDPSQADISDVTIGSQSVSDDFLDRRLFGWSSLRGWIGDWLSENNISSFRIENNRAIGDTR